MCFPEHRRESHDQGRLDVFTRGAHQGNEEEPSVCSRSPWLRCQDSREEGESRHQVLCGGIERAWALDLVRTGPSSLATWLSNFSFLLGKIALMKIMKKKEEEEKKMHNF